MKLGIIFAMALFSQLSFAFECQTNDAQFFGIIANVEKNLIDQNIYDCKIYIQYTRFDASKICPLNEAEVSQIDVKNTNCPFEVGNKINGRITKDEKTGEVELDYTLSK
jgi:hypothetical protein